MRPSPSERLRVFVSGCSGVFGSHFAKHLLDQGHEVFSIRRTERPNNSAKLLGIEDKINWMRGDIRDSALLKELLATWDIQHVAHFAALPIVRTGTLIAEPIFSTNVMGTVAVLEAVKSMVAGGRKVHMLYVSTDKALGYAGDRPYTEDMPLKGEGLYEASKAMGEMACRSFHAQGYIPHLVVTRSCNVIATADLHWRLLPCSVRTFMTDKPARVFTQGQYIREFIAVEDAVRAQWMCLLRADETPGETFHIGSGKQAAQEEVITHIRDNHFPEGIITRVDPPSYHRIEIPYQTLDSSKIRERHGWKPEVSFEDAVANLVAWWKQHENLAPWSML